MWYAYLAQVHTHYRAYARCKALHCDNLIARMIDISCESASQDGQRQFFPDWACCCARMTKHIWCARYFPTSRLGAEDTHAWRHGEKKI